VANVTDAVVKEYFESLGYLVFQPHKHAMAARSGTGDEAVDLVVTNPSVAEHRLPADFVWDTADLRTVRSAVVGVVGWHTDRIYAANIENTPEILRFVQPPALRFSSRVLGSEVFAKVLCLPALPASGELKQKTIGFLRSGGIDGVIPFRAMLLELVRRVETNRNYEKSDLLQVIRLMKNYDLVNVGQMDLFDKKRTAPAGKQQKARRAKAPEPSLVPPPTEDAPPAQADGLEKTAGQ
jgi:hypothetical protein